MRRKNSSVILKESFETQEDLFQIYSLFKKKIKFYIKKKLLVAVSGGPDSLALTALSKALVYEKKCKIYYVLIDHNLRKGSSKEALSVKKLLKKHKINLFILKNSKVIDKNIQSQAREIRYELLSKFCKKKNISTILTAHNLEDQVETFFIRLSRGSGLHGLSSMKEVSKLEKKIILVRPLLDVKKIKLIKISKIIFGKFYKDPSNNNSKYLRTRIRGLKTTLEKGGVSYDQITKSIKNLSASRDTLDLHFNKIYKDLFIEKKRSIFLDLYKFNNLNQEMRMRTLSRSIKDVSKSYYPLRSKKIINLDAKLKMKNNLKLSLAGCLIFKDKKQIIIKKTEKN